MTVKPSYRIDPTHPAFDADAEGWFDASVIEGWLVPDTRLQAIADAREAATAEAIEWFANAGLMSDFEGFTGTDIADLMDHIYAALGIDALTKEDSG